MADATAFTNLGAHKIGRPTDGVPAVASTVNSTSTTVTSTVPFLDEAGTVIATKIRVSAKILTGNNKGFVEVFEVPAGNISADGLTFTGVTRGIEPGGIDTSGNTNFAVELPQGTILGIAPTAGQMNLIIQYILGTIPSGANNLRVGDLTDSDIRVYAQNSDGNKPFIGYDASGNNWVFSNDGSTESPMGGTAASFASAAEINTGTEAAKSIAPDQLQLSNRNIRYIIFNLVDSATDVTVATDVGGDFVIPFAGVILQDDTLTEQFYAANTTAGTTGTMVVDVHLNGTTIMTTNKLDIETTEKSSETAATQPDLTTTAVAAGDILTFDVDAIHTTAAKGLKVGIAIRAT